MASKKIEYEISPPLYVAFKAGESEIIGGKGFARIEDAKVFAEQNAALVGNFDYLKRKFPKIKPPTDILNDGLNQPDFVRAENARRRRKLPEPTGVK